VDKRTLIAVILITAIFVIYYTLFIRRPKEDKDSITKTHEVAEDTTGKKEPKEPPEISEPGEGEGIKAAELEIPEEMKGAEKIIKVRTNVIEARLSTLGGTLLSMRLLEYPGEDNAPVELIPEDENPLGIVLLGDDINIDLIQFPTRCDRDSIILTGEVRDSLVFYYAANDSTFLKKVYVFYPNGYLMDLRIELLQKTGYGMNIDFSSGLASTEKDKREEGMYASMVAMLGETFERADLRKIKEEKTSIDGTIRWTGIKSKYFLFLLLPQDDLLEKITYWNIEKERIGLTLTTKRCEKAACSMYFGPVDYYALKEMGGGLERVVYFGWGWIAPISKVIFFIFTGIHRVIANYGVVIIIFSIIMMVVFFPLTFRSHASMRRMQKLQPKMDAIRKKHKDDPQKMNAEIMKLYSQNKVNPVGGCLPLLLQMPIFFALYAVLRSTIELRRAPFMLWIKDLSARDPFFILPILMGIAMYVQQRFTVTDPRQKMMTYFMPIFLVFIFARLPSGIVLYWLVYNLLSILQQYLITRSEKKEEVVIEPEEK
jgi:YidC/Oxa1 family membrane protein insertase